MTLRVATYNVHGCVGTDGRRSEERIAEVIASLRADVVGLQELDLGRARSGGVDQAKAISNFLGWHFVFHPALRRGDEQYGNAILSRYPLKMHRACELPGRGSWYCRETRIAIWGEIESELGRVQIVNTHFGLGRAERLRQAELLMTDEWLGGISDASPLILLGDFNSIAGGRTHRLLAQRWNDVRSSAQEPLRTFPTQFPVAAVDHIFTNAALKVAQTRVHREAPARVASDHFPFVAELKLLEN